MLRSVKYNSGEKNGSNVFGLEKKRMKIDKYKQKYKKIKRLVKDLIFENAALCDQIATLQEKIIHLMEERNFLLKKLQQFQPVGNGEQRGNTMAGSQDPSTHKKSSTKKKVTDPSEIVKSVKASSKKSTAPKKKKIVKSILSDNCGKPIFPIVLGDFTVHSLGEVCEKPEYHTEDLIYPVGYCSTRIYGSLKDPEKQCVYTCKVMDGGHHPKFEIVADTDLDVPLVSQSIDECHSLLLQLINTCLGCEVVNTKGRGPEFFGLSHPTIHHLVQASPGVRKCKGYVWTKFEVNPNYEYVADETEASLSYSALLRSIAFSKSHLEPKQEYQPEDTPYRNMLLS